MKTLTIHLPDNIDLTDREAILMLSAKLFEKGKLTLGQAARVAGVSKKSFIDILEVYDISPINTSSEDIENDINNARNYSV